VDIQAKASDANLMAVVKDSQRFVLRFFEAIELSAAHIYESALLLSPSSSLVRTLYQDQLSMDLKLNDIDDAWDACIRTIRSQSHVQCAVFSHKDDLVAVGEEGVVEIFEVATGQRRATLVTKYDVKSLAFSPDDNIIATRSDKVHIWDFQTGGLAGTLMGHTDNINSVVFSPCGNMIATCSRDRTVRIWNTFSLDCKSVLEGHSDEVQTVCWSAPGSKVISGSSDNTIKVWSVSDKQCPPPLSIHSGGKLYSIASSSDSSLIAVGSSYQVNKIKVFDAETSRRHNRSDTQLESRATSRHTKTVNCISFSPDGQLIVSGSGDSTVKIWETSTGQCLTTFPEKVNGVVTEATFSPDSRLCAFTGSDKSYKF
jgi:WD40 repeat protein